MGRKPFSGEKRESNSKMKHYSGSLPEFKHITDMAGIYSAFTQANLRDNVLKKK